MCPELKEIDKCLNILDKMEFFNQRAGRELWFDKPKNIQGKDIENFNKDINTLKEYILKQLDRINHLDNQGEIDFEDMAAGVPVGGNKKDKEVKQVIVDPRDLASAVNAIGYENVLNMIPCHNYDGCIVVVLYKE